MRSIMSACYPLRESFHKKTSYFVVMKVFQDDFRKKFSNVVSFKIARNNEIIIVSIMIIIIINFAQVHSHFGF